MDPTTTVTQNWDVIGIFVLGLLGVLVTLLGKKKPEIVPVIPGPSPVQQDADKKQVEDEKKAQEAHDKQAADDQKKHDDEVVQNVDELKKKTDEIKDNTQATNDTLLDISKQVRDAGRP